MIPDGSRDGGGVSAATRLATRVRTRAREAFSRAGVRKVSINIGWLVGERGLTLAAALAVNVVLARYLGPTDFGALNFAISFVGLFGTFTYLGFSGIVTRDLVLHPEDRDELLGTTFVLKLAGAAAAILAIVGLARIVAPAPDMQLLIAIIAAGLLFDAFLVITFWFESRVEARYSVRATGAAVLGGAALKIALVLLKAPLVAFAIAVAAQKALTALGLWLIFRRRGASVRGWRFTGARARALFAQSWPLILSSVGALLYLKIDQVMLGAMAGNEEVGIYAVAARLSEVWYVLPTAVATSLLPGIVKLRKGSAERYRRALQRIFDILFVASLAVAIPVTLVAGPLMDLLFGPEYVASTLVLRIHIWTAPAMFMGAVLSKWLIAEDMLLFSFTRQGLGALVNVALNLALIPRFGAVGAAIATLVSYTVASYLACFTDRRTRHIGWMMTRAIAGPVRLLSTARSA